MSTLLISSTETQAQKNTDICICIWKNRKTHKFWQSRLARRAVNCCHDGPGHGWCRYSPQRLRIRSWPLTSTLQHQNNSLWFWHCNIKTMTPRLITAYTTQPLEILTGQTYETRHISHLLLSDGGGPGGGKLPKAFCSFALLLGQEHAWFGHKKVVPHIRNIHNFTKIIRIFLRIYVFARVDIDNQHHWWSEIAVQIQSCSFCHLCGNKITKGGRSPRKRLRFDPQTKAAILLQITNITISIKNKKKNKYSYYTALCFSNDLSGSWLADYD